MEKNNGCYRCNGCYEDKFVQCFDELEISMYLKPNGVVKLIHNEITEMTNFNYCPYCGRNLKKQRRNSSGRNKSRRVC